MWWPFKKKQTPPASGECQTLFFNQGCWHNKGKPIGEWNDTCKGHTELYEAMACNEHQRQWLDASYEPKDLIDWMASTKVKIQKQNGNILHLRIIKRTTTEEVIEQ